MRDAKALARLADLGSEGMVVICAFMGDANALSDAVQQPPTQLKVRMLTSCPTPCPLTATSKTRSSFGSRSGGRHKNAISTGRTTSAKTSSKFKISLGMTPAANSYSGRSKTVSYSKNNGTLRITCICRVSTRRRISPEAPRGLRTPATGADGGNGNRGQGLFVAKTCVAKMGGTIACQQ